MNVLSLFDGMSCGKIGPEEYGNVVKILSNVGRIGKV